MRVFDYIHSKARRFCPGIGEGRGGGGGGGFGGWCPFFLSGGFCRWRFCPCTIFKTTTFYVYYPYTTLILSADTIYNKGTLCLCTLSIGLSIIQHSQHQGIKGEC